LSLRSLGLLLITAGFLAGAWITVQQVDTVRWSRYVPMAVLGALGVVLANVGTRRRARAADTLQRNIATARETLARIVRNLDELEEKKANIETHDLHAKIDESFARDLADFADARESIAHIYGLGNYAEVMNHFAAGERYLNRVWSASVDGYVNECLAFIAHAREQFHDAHDRLTGLQASTN